MVERAPSVSAASNLPWGLPGLPPFTVLAIEAGESRLLFLLPHLPRSPVTFTFANEQTFTE